MGDVASRMCDALCVAMSRAHRRSAAARRSDLARDCRTAWMHVQGGVILAIAVGLVLAIGPATQVLGISPIASASAAPAPMVLTYDTALGGTTLDLPLSGGSVTVNWGDGTTYAALAHAYASPGRYTVSISGAATHFGNPNGYLGCAGITGVASFGDLGITDLSGAFAAASHLTSVPAALPPGVTSMSHMFGARPPSTSRSGHGIRPTSST